MIINTIDTTPVGVCFGGELSHNKGMNEATFSFDTSYLVPGHYTIDAILYDDDEQGNVMFYDRCTAMRFHIEHSADSIHLHHWFKDWGNAVLPCLREWS